MDKELAKTIKVKRQEYSYTQIQLAREANVSYHWLIKLEGGYIKNPSIWKVLNIADALHLSLDTLIWWCNPDRKVKADSNQRPEQYLTKDNIAEMYAKTD